ncbi:MAG: putative RecB family exonuclease, partial [Pseudonocardiales bacterium]|nr:putative RecB family exonuclease [Pseudonocardiales bacterium]
MSDPLPAADTAAVTDAINDAATAVATVELELPVAVVGSLSPSRAADFKTCPLLYRFRSIDRLPEKPTRDATRG